MKHTSGPRPPIRRRDAAGHIDPGYAKHLLALSGQSVGDDRTQAFLERPYTNDELPEELGEAFVEGATSGEGAGPERLDRVVAFEEGGPFVLTPAWQEFAGGVDDSNPRGSTKEPFPRALGGGDGS